mmetsp:Transcript_7230/g.23952  ORF Transcript_7230/g.23952 Transcript_7230/m.23952 type:complete len:315 (-) Transcript_7230:468-1412(-)
MSSLSHTKPACLRPVAIICAPVSVAISTMTFGFIVLFSGSVQYATPSPKTNRPSASVLFISTVFPLLATRISSGRIAPLPIAFSAMQSTRSSGVLNSSAFSVAMASNAPNMPAAPPMSVFMPHIPSLLLRLKPPVSNVMPLPTNAMDGALGSGHPLGVKRKCTSAGSRPSLVDARPTPASIPYPSDSSCVNRLISTIFTLAPSSTATRLASSTNVFGSNSFGAESTSVWHRRSAFGKLRVSGPFHTAPPATTPMCTSPSATYPLARNLFAYGGTMRAMAEIALAANSSFGKIVTTHAERFLRSPIADFALAAIV